MNPYNISVFVPPIQKFFLCLYLNKIINCSQTCLLNLSHTDHPRLVEDDVHELPQVQVGGTHQEVVSGPKQIARQRPHHRSATGNYRINFYSNQEVKHREDLNNGLIRYLGYEDMSSIPIHLIFRP